MNAGKSVSKMVIWKIGYSEPSVILKYAIKGKICYFDAGAGEKDFVDYWIKSVRKRGNNEHLLFVRVVNKRIGYFRLTVFDTKDVPVPEIVPRRRGKPIPIVPIEPPTITVFTDDYESDPITSQCISDKDTAYLLYLEEIKKNENKTERVKTCISTPSP